MRAAGHGELLGWVGLAEKSGQFMPKDTAGRCETLQWLMFQMGAVGPLFGQIGFFHKFAGNDCADPRPRDRYADESRRLPGGLDPPLATRDWLMADDYAMADIATFPRVNNQVGFCGAGERVGFKDFKHVARALDAFTTNGSNDVKTSQPARPAAACHQVYGVVAG